MRAGEWSAATTKMVFVTVASSGCGTAWGYSAFDGLFEAIPPVREALFKGWGSPPRFIGARENR